MALAIKMNLKHNINQEMRYIAALSVYPAQNPWGAYFKISGGNYAANPVDLSIPWIFFPGLTLI